MKRIGVMILSLLTSSCAELAPRSTIDVSTSPGEGRVVAIATYEHAPLPGADVILEQGKTRIACTTDVKGVCTGDVGAGEWSVSVALLGMVPAKTTISVSSTTAVTVRADLVLANIESITIAEPPPPPGPGEFRMWHSDLEKLPVW